MSARSVGRLAVTTGFTPGATEFNDVSGARTQAVPECLAAEQAMDEGN